MNLGVFNRVNLKESSCGGMYSEWTSLTLSFQNGEGNEERSSVLDKFPVSSGKDVVLAVVKPLAANLGITQASEPSVLSTDREVRWNMEVICYGLSLPISEHDTIRDCVNVYCEWLSALHPVPKISVPRPVCEDPNLYARKIIGHFHNLFIPRKNETPDAISRQAVLCHRVLRTLQHLAQVSTIMNQETWEALLVFLLAINNTILSPPTVKDDVGDQLCERVLSVLMELWLIACVRCFPAPPLWKTLREMCMNWRHRVPLVEQWNRVHLALTAKLLEYTYGPDFPRLKISDEDANLVPPDASHDCIAQSWYRFFHCLGNPVNLCRPAIISQTPKFLQYAIASETVVDPCQHPCLSVLPQIFFKAIRGIAGQVDAFLGISSGNSASNEDTASEKDKKERDRPPSTPTPPPQRRLAKSFSVAPSAVSKGIPKGSLIGLTSSRVTSVVHVPTSTPNSGSGSSQTSVISAASEGYRSQLSPNRPKCNSILHLFGNWLFEAANIGWEDRCTFLTAFARGSSSKSGFSGCSQPNSLNEQVDSAESALVSEKYSAGKAEAFGALCRIFTAKKTGEEILPVYLARFYVSLVHGLEVPENRECNDVIASILINSCDLFRLDLDGVTVLLPSFVDALELVFSRTSKPLKTDIRQACIHLLLSMLSLPLHFQNLQLKEMLCCHFPEEKNCTFVGELKPRLVNLLLNALETETDPVNTQMLLAGLLLSVQDSVCCEGESVTQPDGASNLFSSGSDTTSGRSFVTMSERRSLGGDSSTDFAHESTSDCAHGLFTSTTHRVCHRLISSWKSDLNVSLAALELLSGLARVHMKETDDLESKRAVKWLCEYIVTQCKRPPPAHSKDLHSTIVAAFSCLSVWLVEHPCLLNDKDCLMFVLEVVELGISGCVSQGKAGELVKMKDEKESKPASMRVRDAAENLLNIILEQVGYFPSPCGPESCSCLLEEVSLLKLCNSWPGGNVNKNVACQRFKYFVVDNSILLALLEEPLGNDQDPQPTVTAIIRGPFGRYAWTMQLRHLPRHQSGTKHVHTCNVGRPVPLNEAGTCHETKHKFFPDAVEKIVACKIDKSIPNIESCLTDEKAASDQTRMLELMDYQLELEEAMRRVGQQSENCLSFPDPERECYPPPVKHEFQTARLFLSHFGLVSCDSNKNHAQSPLAVLDSQIPGFSADLEALDSMGSRTCDTVHVFYVKAGQKTTREILHNVVPESSVDPRFTEMLYSLGWPVDVHQHPGWTGSVFTSWKSCAAERVAADEMSISSPSTYNGERYVLYWADVSSEIAFIVPTSLQTSACTFSRSMLDPNCISYEFSTQGRSECPSSDFVSLRNQQPQSKPRALSLDLDKRQSTGEPARPGRRSAHSRNQSMADPPTKVLVVWLEHFEDNAVFPLGELLEYCNTGAETTTPKAEDAFVIFLHALNSGLLRVKLVGPTGRMSMSTPLLDGIVVSKRALGSLVRQTALNICRRRRLDNDNYHPPHVRRRLKVVDLLGKYCREMSQPQLLSYLFS